MGPLQDFIVPAVQGSGTLNFIGGVAVGYALSRLCTRTWGKQVCVGHTFICRSTCAYISSVG